MLFLRNMSYARGGFFAYYNLKCGYPSKSPDTLLQEGTYKGNPHLLVGKINKKATLTPKSLNFSISNSHLHISDSHEIYPLESQD